MQITGGTFLGGISFGAPVVPPVSTQNWAFTEVSDQFDVADIDYYIQSVTSWTLFKANNTVRMDADWLRTYKGIGEVNLPGDAYNAPNAYASGTIVDDFVSYRRLSNAEITALFVDMSVGTEILVREYPSANIVTTSFVSGNFDPASGFISLTLNPSTSWSNTVSAVGILVKYTSNALNTLAITT